MTAFPDFQRAVAHLFLSAVAPLILMHAEETWAPHAHPALLEKRIIAFTEPARRLDLASEVPGRISAIRYQAGETATAEPAVQLDPEGAQLALTQAEREAQRAAQRLMELRSLTTFAEQARNHEKTELERIASLADDGSIAVQLRDDRAQRLRQAEAELAAAQARAGLAQIEVDAAATAQAQAARTLRQHALLAPAGWQVRERLLEPGATVQPGEPILRLVDVTELSIKTLLTESEVAAVRAGALRLAFSHHPDRAAITPRLHQVDPDHDPASRKRRIELRLAGNDAPEASGGLMVELRLPIREPADAVTIPKAFINAGIGLHRVQMKDGGWRELRVYRADTESVVAAGADLPTDAVLLPVAAAVVQSP